MKEAATAAGMKQKEIARRLSEMGFDVEGAEISRWYQGIRTPSDAKITAFARVVGVPEDKFREGLPPSAADIAEPRQEAIKLMVRIIDAWQTGLSLPSAMEEVTDTPAPYSPEERRQLERHSARLRALLTEEIGAAWDTLSPEEKEDICLRVLATGVQRRSSEGHRGARVRSWGPPMPLPLKGIPRSPHGS